MSGADALIAVSTLMLEAASREDWSSVEALDEERRSLIAALPPALESVTVDRLKALDRQLLVMAQTERTRLDECIRVGQKLDKAAREYATAARLVGSGSNGTP